MKKLVDDVFPESNNRFLMTLALSPAWPISKSAEISGRDSKLTIQDKSHAGVPMSAWFKSRRGIDISSEKFSHGVCHPALM